MKSASKHLVRMLFGKYAGKPLQQIPRDYLHWVLLNVHGLEPPLRVAIMEQLGTPKVNAVDLYPRRTAGGGRMEAVRTANSLRDKIRDVFREKLIEHRLSGEDRDFVLTEIGELQEAVDKVISEHLGSA